jgi:tRNA(His) 5'-end guanylyltransferase
MPKHQQPESWNKEETEYLLRVIRERQVMKRLDGKKFTAEEIFQHLERPMHDRGYLKIAKQMQTRFKPLRCRSNTQYVPIQNIFVKLIF